MSEKANTIWKHGENCMLVKTEDVDDLIEKISWAQANPEETGKIAEQAIYDTNKYFVESESGGKLYLNAFRELMDKK